MSILQIIPVGQDQDACCYGNVLVSGAAYTFSASRGNLHSLGGNLSIQVTQVDICNAAITEWKLLILVKKRLGARYVRPVTIPDMLTPCFRLLWSFQRKMLLLVDPTLTEAGLCLLWSFRRDPLLLIDLSLALR